jgi:hypothetical protein
MARNYSGMSDLEREIELEMDSELEGADTSAELEGPEYEDDAREAGDTYELEAEGGFDQEADEETEDVSELEFDGGDREQEYVERFLEIASREYESESEVDAAMNEVLDGMAREYLFGKIFKKVKKFGSKLASNPAIRGLVKKGLSVAAGQFPALKAALALAKGDLKGSLLNLGKQALGAAIPGGPAMLGALGSLGFTGEVDPQSNREAWGNYVQMSREAFEHMANNLTPTTDQPMEASRVATNAYRHAMRRAQVRAGTGRPARGGVGGGIRAQGGVVRHHLQPGQRIVITGAGKLIVKGR